MTAPGPLLVTRTYQHLTADEIWIDGDCFTADFVRRAVNGHDDLVKALKEAEKTLAHLAEFKMLSAANTLHPVRAALAKAGGAS